MRKPRSSRDAALLGIAAGLSPLHSCGVQILDALYQGVTLGVFLVACLALAEAGCTPAYASTFGPFDHPTIQPSDPSTIMDADLISTDFLWALAGVESGHNDAAVNAAEGAHGRFQIRQGYLTDANEVLGTAYTLRDMHDPRLAMEVVRAYLGRYAPAFEARTGRPATAVDLARIHNGGPRGAEKDCTLAYARRFAKEARL